MRLEFEALLDLPLEIHNFPSPRVAQPINDPKKERAIRKDGPKKDWKRFIYSILITLGFTFCPVLTVSNYETAIKRG